MPEWQVRDEIVGKEVNEIIKHVNELPLDVQMQELKEQFQRC